MKMVFLRKKLKKLRYNYTINSLKKISPEKIIQDSEKKAISAFNRASSSISFYKHYLKTINKDKINIKDIESFRIQVPIVDKQNIFTPPNIKKIMSYNTSCTTQSILLSSGSTGTFSFGLNTQNEMKKGSQFLEIFLNYYFNIIENGTLILNCFPQAVKLSTNGITIAEIGPRSDSFTYLLSTISKMFDQTIIIGDNYFIKNAIEDGIKEGINFKELKIHLIVGGVYLPENLRTYLAKLLYIDLKNPQTGLIMSSMGLSEFGLNVFFESKETIALRRLMNEDITIRKKTLPNPSYPYLPMFFNYFPQSHFLEEINGEIIITNLCLSSVLLPLIRYNSKDKGNLLPYCKLEALKIEKDYLPPFNSPLALVYGKNEFVEIQGKKKVYPQLIQEGLFSDDDVASSTTGNFRIINEEEKPVLHIQLKDAVSLNKGLLNKFSSAITSYTNIEIPITLHLYQNFPFSMVLDYEKKFKYI